MHAGHDVPKARWIVAGVLSALVTGAACVVGVLGWIPLLILLNGFPSAKAAEPYFLGYVALLNLGSGALVQVLTHALTFRGEPSWAKRAAVALGFHLALSGLPTLAALQFVTS